MKASLRTRAPIDMKKMTSMRTSLGTTVILAAVLLAGCGSDDGARAKRESPAKRSSSAPASMSAEEVAAEARGKVKCPPKIATPARADNAPVDDVVGVRPGMSYEEAAGLVLCTHDLMVVNADTSRRFNIKTYGATPRQGFSARFAEPRVAKTSRQIMQEMQDQNMARANNKRIEDMQPGQSKWYVGTLGVPGEERVVNVAREEWFEEGRNPPMATVEQALINKYGTPAREQMGGQQRLLIWIHDPLGRAVSKGSPLYHQCSIQADPDAATSFSPDCGVVVAATVVPMRDNADVARYFQVAVIDQARGYEQITGTERALAALDAERRADELSRAAKSSGEPTL